MKCQDDLYSVLERRFYILVSNNSSAEQLKTSLVFQNPTNRILEFGMHAFADNFLSTEDLKYSELIYPLNVLLDSKTGMIHNEYLTKAEERYQSKEYSYTSSNSLTSKQHWKSFLPFFEKIGAKPGDSVLEIGSNDGYLSLLLSEAGFHVNAVEASKNMHEISSERGVTTHNYLFNLENALKIKELIGPVDYVIANNVLNHANDPVDFLNGVKKLMKKSGRFIFEVPYWFEQIKHNRFDMIYHEHISYFTLFSLSNIFSELEMFIVEVLPIQTHGGSIRVTVGLKRPSQPSVDDWINMELSENIFSLNYYHQIANGIKSKKFKFMENIFQNYTNRTLFGIGAAAKANTFLTYYGLNSTIIKAITDSSQYKVGKFTPLTRIPIVKDDYLSNYQNPVALILSWNLTNQIKETLFKINKNIEYLEI